MPIRDMHFENGIFSAREIGHIEQADAEKWASLLHHYAEASSAPIIIFVDAREMTLISPEASKIFNKAAEIPNIRVAVIVTGTPLATVLSRMVGMMSRVGRTHETHVFNSYEEAEHFVYKQQDTANA